jgi:unsaturated rhamnogalacturonyl hydrolase
MFSTTRPSVSPHLHRLTAVWLCLANPGLQAQTMTDASAPLHLIQPAYTTPYVKPEIQNITAVMARIYAYLDRTTPPALIQKDSKLAVTEFSQIDTQSVFQPGDFQLVSYEWGVTYAGMLLASEATGDARFADYTRKRLGFLAAIRPWFLKLEQHQPDARHALARVIHPQMLDDCGALCAAMIKTQRLGASDDLTPLINTFIEHIHNNQFRLTDGTLARNRPQPNTLWLDDLFMSVPALAQMGKFTGDKQYYDDATRQILNFAARMFNPDKGLFMHGWIQGMAEHPQFHWARANGWAVMAMIELLDVLPEDHEDRAKVLELLRHHLRGLANYQAQQGSWHQLIDRSDSYLETSATAMFTYAIARAINRGYVDGSVYGPMVCLAWNAVAAQVNEHGQVENTCVGTGMGFDPAFYSYRPVNVYAAHGYGPALLAGAEMILLLKQHGLAHVDNTLQLKP